MKFSALGTIGFLIFFCGFFGAQFVSAQVAKPVDVASVIADMSDESFSKRSAALKELKKLDSLDAPLLTALKTMATEDDSQSFRQSAVQLLGEKGKPQEVVGILLTCLNDTNDSVKRKALETIIAGGLKTGSVRNGLLKAMSTSPLLSSKVHAALESFDNVDPAALLDAMIQAARLHGSSLASSKAASFVFDPCCQRALDQSQSELDRVICIQFLRNHHGASEDQRAQRQAIFDKCIAPDSPTQIRYAVLYSSANKYLDREQQEPIIDKAIVESELNGLRTAAILAAGRRRLKHTVPSLVRVATEVPKERPDFSSIGFACEMIAKMPEAASDAVPKLVAVYDNYAADTITQSQGKLLTTIGQIGTHPNASIPLFQRVLQEDSSKSNKALGPYAAVLVRNKMDLSPVIEHAKRALEKNQLDHAHALALTKALGAQGKPLAEQLIQKTKAAPDYETRSWIEAISYLGPAAKDAAPFIREQALAAEYPETYLLSLARLKDDSLQFIDVVEPMLDDDKKRVPALKAIAKFDSGIESLVPKLMKLIEEKTEMEYALDAIGAAGKVDRETLTKIKAFSDNDRDSYLQSVAAATILRLYPNKPKVIAYCLSKMTNADNGVIRKLRSTLGSKLDNVLAVGKASPDPPIQKVALRLSEDPPEE